MSADCAPVAVQHLTPFPGLLEGEDIEAPRRGVTRVWARWIGLPRGRVWKAGPYVMGPWHCSATSSSSRGGATSLQK